MFGALGAVRVEATYPASAQALEDSTALAIKSKFLHELIKTRPYISFDLMNLMSSYIQEMQSRYRELATERVEQRVANALIRLAGQSGIRAEKKAVIVLSFSRQDVAEMTGTTLYTVSRLLSEWERQGIIETGRERISITKPMNWYGLRRDLRNNKKKPCTCDNLRQRKDRYGGTRYSMFIMNDILAISEITVADVLMATPKAVRFFIDQGTGCAICSLARFAHSRKLSLHTTLMKMNSLKNSPNLMFTNLMRSTK